MSCIENLLDVEIADVFDMMSKMDKTSEEYKTLVDCQAKLMDRRIEMEKVGNENHEKEVVRKVDRTDRYISHGVTIGLALLSAGVAVWGTKASFEFEKEGTITTIFGRGWVNKLLPRR